MAVYKTQSLYEGAFLLAKGFNIVGKERLANKVTVIFEGDNIEEAALNFYNGSKIEAKKYSDCYRTLKDYIFER